MTSFALVRDEKGRFARTPVEFVDKADYDNVLKLAADLENDNFSLSERLADIEMMIDSKGWHQVFEHGADGGLSLQQIKSASEQLREMVAGNPIMGQGCRLRTAYVWGQGVQWGAIDATGKSSKLTAATRTFLEEPRNVKYVFSPSAAEELEKAAFTDGNLYLVGDEITKRLFRIGIDQITGTIRDPDNPEEIWAYRRVWSPNPDEANPVQMTRWYYTDSYDGERRTQVSWNGRMEQADITKTIIDAVFNRQVGWGHGVPDALAVLAWARIYREFLVNGYVMSRALAKIAYKVTVQSAAGAANSAAEISKPGAGQTDIRGEGNTIEAMPQAGKGYDFSSGRPLLAVIAAGLGLSTTALGADAGGTNAAEQTLDAPTRGMAEVRRNVWRDYFTRVLRWAGNRKTLKMTFVDLTTEQIQRRLQGWTQMHMSGLFSEEIIQRGMADEMDIADPGDIPDTYVRPTGGNAISPTDGSGQGQSNGPAGGLGNDHSTDPPSE